MKITMNQKKQLGLSLIEIQVALVIGLILTAGAAQLFISNQQTYRSENALTRMQQNGRFIVDTIAKDIRMAGYTGCTSREGSAPVVDNIGTLPYNVVDIADGSLTNVIAASDATNGAARVPALPGTLTGNIANILPNADTITVQRSHQCGAAVAVTAAAGGGNITVYSPNQCNFQAGMGAMITNCGRSDLFQITGSTADTGPSQNLTFGGALASTYGDDAFVYQFMSNTYYIAPSQIDPADPAPEPALWVDQWDPTAAGGYNSIELADGVEDFEIQYGVDNAGDQYPDVYQDIDAALDMSTVRSVRINLLLRSADNITTQPQQLNFMGAPANIANDRRLRTVYSSTITVRNQLP